MTLSPVEKPTKTYDAITEQLKKLILDGTYLPDSRLPSVRELSEQLSVSQPAVREALTALKALKLITIRQGEGTFVNHYDPRELTYSTHEWMLMNKADIQSLLELRKIMEAGAARLAASRRTTDDVRNLDTIVAKMENEMSSFQLGEESDWALHLAIARASQNSFLASLMECIGERIQHAVQSCRHALYQFSGEPERLLEQHRSIVDAIRKGHEDRAEAEMVAHLSHVESALQEIIS